MQAFYFAHQQPVGRLKSISINKNGKTQKISVLRIKISQGVYLKMHCQTTIYEIMQR